mmetsp:Transcript_100388/g.299577  ORF Transcript_100388/g.299577 Transcript_100388/m.299577 type:complete len:229 (-) Transcript_100388:96-782(-)
MGYLYPQVCAVQRHLTCNQVRATFGVSGSDSPGKMAFPAVQMVPALASTFAGSLFAGKKLRCLVPCGVEQDPYFRLTRDLARRMGEHKPAVLQSKFLPSLAGTHAKMSSSDGSAASLLLSDAPKVVRQKVNRAFSGGRDTKEEQQRLGANVDVDVPLRYLRCFAGLAGAEGPDVAAVSRAYAAGKLLSGEVKRMAADAISAVQRRHQELRRAVSDADVALFMTRRQLC